ncbi:MAG: ribosome recycling factor [Gammaproteobacteria bacterium]|nr:ribosome recycling factor [Gammaproteobacteria bacterium]
MIEEIKKDASERMDKSIEALKQSLSKVRTGRAHPSLLDHLTVDYYGSQVPISQVANISIEDSRTLAVTPWEKQMVQVIEKAIISSDLGLNPATAGMVMRIPLPPLTEETRRNLAKVVRNDGEAAKVAIRNIRRDANSDFKDLLKEKEISEDDERKAQDDIQRITDKHVADVDSIVTQKEAELMEV